MEHLPQEDEKHLFDSIVTDFNKKIKLEVSLFINSPSKFENNIDGFLSTIVMAFAGQILEHLPQPIHFFFITLGLFSNIIFDTATVL